MPSHATERVLAVVESDPALMIGFAAELGGDPEDFSVFAGETPDLLALDPPTVGAAFAEYVAQLRLYGPDLVSGLADVDLSGVDWAAVGAQITASLQNQQF